MTSPLPSLDALIGLKRQHGVDIKPTLLRILTDFYVSKPTHTDTERDQYVELARRLIEVADADTRRLVRQRLADYATAPAELVVLLNLDLTATPAGERSATATAPDSASEMALPMPLESMSLAPMSLGALFFAAGDDERRTILAHLDHDQDADPEAVPAEIRERAIRLLETSALAGRPAEFIRTLEVALLLPRAIAERIVSDAGGEAMVAAARALAMPLPVLQRILLFVNPAIGHSVRRVYDLTALYGEIAPRAALRLIASWREPAVHAAPVTARKPATPPAAFGDDERRLRPGSYPAAPRSLQPSFARRAQRTN